MADAHQRDGILRYLKDMDYKFLEPLGKPGLMFEYDLEYIAREAMTKGAQLRMTSEGFPQELRLQVMKAGVSYHASTFNFSCRNENDDFDRRFFFDTQGEPDYFENAVKSLFDTRHTIGRLHDTLKKLAEQALFEAAIFKIHKYFFEAKEGATHSDTVALLLSEDGKLVQHLELIAHMIRTPSYRDTLTEAANTWTSLRHCSPNLKACVFTVVLRTGAWEPYPHIFTTRADETFSGDLLQEVNEQGETVGDTIAKLFAEFAERGPGVRRFIRIQHVRIDEGKYTATAHYGPLVEVPSTMSQAGASGPIGEDMLTKAYRFARTGETHEYVRPKTHFR